MLSTVFIDGLHTAEQSHRDVLNALERLEPGGVILLHDCNPQSAAAAAPTLDEAVAMPGFAGDWNGDVFRTIVRLRTRDDVRVHVLDCDHGVGVVVRGRCAEPLGLSDAEIEALTYDDLARDRAALLGLRPASDLDELLAARSR